MTKQWVKLSVGVHQDRKMWKLSKDAQLVFFYLLSVAGTEDNDGNLPSVDDLALELWFLKLSDRNLKSVLDELEKAEIIERSGSDLRLKNYSKWQVSEKTKAESNREYYLKKKKSQSEPKLNSEKIQSEIQSEIQETVSLNSAEIQSLDKEIEKEIDINTSANAEVQNAKIQTAEAKTPDDPSFWGFARENAKLAEAFYCETGIAPVKKEFGRWVNDLRDLAEAGINIQGIRDTVAYMRSKGLPIGAPGSLLKTARWLKTNPQKQPQTRSPSASERWDKAEAELQSRFADDIFGMLPYVTTNTEIIDI